MGTGASQNPTPNHPPIPETIEYIAPNEDTKRFQPAVKRVTPGLIQAVQEEKYNPALISGIIKTIETSAIECARALQSSQTTPQDTAQMETAYRTMQVALKRLETREIPDTRSRAIAQLQQSCEPYEFLNDGNIKVAFDEFFHEHVIRTDACLGVLQLLEHVYTVRDNTRKYIQRNYVSPEVFPISGVMRKMFHEEELQNESSIDATHIINMMCDRNLFVDTADSLTDYATCCRELEMKLRLMTNYPIFTFDTERACRHNMIYIGEKGDAGDEFFGGGARVF